MVAADLQNKNIVLTREFDGKIPETLIDSDQITQMLLNIFMNSIEAMEPGGELRVAMRLKNGKIELSISDTGEGIPQKDKDRIFDPFFTTKSSGTGLGLTIVYRIIEDHEGEIKVRSEENKGTTFYITLPVR
jgi:signal transduction histidine kinase